MCDYNRCCLDCLRKCGCNVCMQYVNGTYYKPQRPIKTNLKGTDTVTDDRDHACVVCLVNVKCVLVDCCKGVPYCIGCARDICKNKSIGNVTCPLCRKLVRKVIRIYI